MPKILITGGNGYIASQLKLDFISNGYDVVCSSRNKLEQKCDYVFNDNSENAYLDIIKQAQPDIIIHTAWINSIDLCEKDNVLADLVNVQWSKDLINAIKIVNTDIKLVFISSDYVFDGHNGEYTEEDECKPVTYYGKNKVSVEELINNSGLKHLIIRTANVYDHGGKFFNFLFSNLSENKSVDVFYDTFFSPTYMRYFTDSVIQLLSKNTEGVVHLAGEERISRYNFAFKLASVMGIDERKVVPISKPNEMLIAHDVSLDSSFSRQLLSNFSPSVEKSFQFLLGRIIYPYFTHYDKRGGMMGIVQNEQKWEEINYVEAVQWAVRGGHYHKNTHEGFYIIDGVIKVETSPLGSDNKNTFIVEKGDIFFIEPYTVHTFYIIKNAKWINFLSKAMKVGKKDIYAA
ncbi:MAG: sugar nucleotide-binding protein [Gammaproteobacteria bacterium]|nr:sugar nucleotide-binding protein [Gammaproteobacteria bacterium]